MWYLVPIDNGLMFIGGNFTNYVHYYFLSFLFCFILFGGVAVVGFVYIEFFYAAVVGAGFRGFRLLFLFVINFIYFHFFKNLIFNKLKIFLESLYLSII